MKNEIRRSYFLNRYVIVAANRKSRPHDFIQDKPHIHEGPCHFCPGHEKRSEEVDRIGTKDKWLVRSILNKFPIVSPAFPKAKGVHEVIIETPKHNTTLSKMSLDELARILEMYVKRNNHYKKQKSIEYVSIFRNEGRWGGVSLTHPHSQLIALPEAPNLVRAELKAYMNNKVQGKGCIFCNITAKERKSPRKVLEDDHFLTFAPYASRFSYELWFFPKKHQADISEMTEDERYSMAEHLQSTLCCLDRLFKFPSYNLYLHQAPKGEDFHFHFELLPRLILHAGFELANEWYVNPVSPEEAAAEYRKC